MRWGLGLTALCLGWVVNGACSLPRSPAVHTQVDQKRPAPEGRPVNPWVRPDDLSGRGGAKEADELCGPRTGRNSQGECERLRSEPWGRGERVLLPKGEVLLGAVPNSYFGGPAEDGSPVIRHRHHALRKAYVDSFWIDVVEVQRVDYHECVKSGQCTALGCADGSDGVPKPFLSEGEAVRDGLPATCVTYKQAQDYCRFRQGTLPTLTQWTYAARGADLRHYSWGPAFDDSVSMGPLPVRVQRDSSYFGIRGLSGSAREIMAGTPKLDQVLEPWLTRPFRSKQGPYLRHVDQWVKRYGCPRSSLNANCRKAERKARHWVSGFGLDQTAWIWSAPPKDESLSMGVNQESLWLLPHADVGFRCVYPKRDSDPALTMPKTLHDPPEFLGAETINLFVGVAQAVNFAEAKAFCASVRLVADRERKDPGAWRLPTQTELMMVQEHRLGPGPLWTASGQAVQAELNEDGTVKGWKDVPADRKNSAILARCVR